MSSVLVSAHLRERKNAPQPSEVTICDLCKDRLTDVFVLVRKKIIKTDK